MASIDLSGLSPEELEALKEAIEHPPVDPLKEMAAAFQLMCDKVGALEQKVLDLEDTLLNKFMGGILEIGQENIRTSRVSGLKSKYGEMFAPYSSYLSDKLGNADDLYDLIDKDGLEEDSIKALAEEIGRRVSEITGKPVEVEVSKTEEAPAEAPAEPEKPKEEATPEDDGMGSIRDFVSKLKDRSGQAA